MGRVELPGLVGVVAVEVRRARAGRHAKVRQGKPRDLASDWRSHNATVAGDLAQPFVELGRCVDCDEHHEPRLLDGRHANE